MAERTYSEYSEFGVIDPEKEQAKAEQEQADIQAQRKRPMLHVTQTSDETRAELSLTIKYNNTAEETVSIFTALGSFMAEVLTPEQCQQFLAELKAEAERRGFHA